MRFLLLFLLLVLLTTDVLACGKNKPKEKKKKEEPPKEKSLTWTLVTPSSVVTSIRDTIRFACTYKVTEGSVGGKKILYWWNHRKGSGSSSNALYDGASGRVTAPKGMQDMEIERRYRRSSEFDLLARSARRGDNWDTLCCVVEIQDNGRRESCINSRIVDFKPDEFWCKVGAEERKARGFIAERVAQDTTYIFRHDTINTVHVECGYTQVYPDADIVISVKPAQGGKTIKAVKLERTNQDKSSTALYSKKLNIDIFFDPTGDEVVIEATAVASDWKMRRDYKVNVRYENGQLNYLWCVQNKPIKVITNGSTVKPLAGHEVYYGCGISYVREPIRIVAFSDEGSGQRRQLVELQQHQSQKIHSSPDIYSNALQFTISTRKVTNIEFHAATSQDTWKFTFTIEPVTTSLSDPSNGYDPDWLIKAKDAAERLAIRPDFDRLGHNPTRVEARTAGATLHDETPAHDVLVDGLSGYRPDAADSVLGRGAGDMRMIHSLLGSGFGALVLVIVIAIVGITVGRKKNVSEDQENLAEEDGNEEDKE